MLPLSLVGFIAINCGIMDDPAINKPPMSGGKALVDIGGGLFISAPGAIFSGLSTVQPENSSWLTVHMV